MATARTRKRPARQRKRAPRMGQHFLADPAVRLRILEHLQPRPEDSWLEIGPGHGEMTLLLAPKVRRLAAVERDPVLATKLQTALHGYPHIEVIQADILKVDVARLASEAGVRQWRVYGSLPYYITSPILSSIFQAGETIADAHVIVQEEVADRLTAQPGSRAFGFLSVTAQYFTTPEKLLAIPRGAFRPAPKVDSALVLLEPPGQQAKLGLKDPEAFLSFAGIAFRHKRKTFVNNLAAHYEADAIRAALTELELDPRCRAEQLSVEQFAKLFTRLAQARTSVAGS